MCTKVSRLYSDISNAVRALQSFAARRINYLRQGCYVFVVVCLSVCLSVC